MRWFWRLVVGGWIRGGAVVVDFWTPSRDSRLGLGLRLQSSKGRAWHTAALQRLAVLLCQKLCRRRVGALSGENRSKTGARDGGTLASFDSNQASTRHAASDGHALSAATDSGCRERMRSQTDARSQRSLLAAKSQREPGRR